MCCSQTCLPADPTGADAEAAASTAASEVALGAGAGGALLSEVLQALADDLNTPSAVSALSGPLKTINDLLTTKAGKKQANRIQV